MATRRKADRAHQSTQEKVRTKMRRPKAEEVRGFRLGIRGGSEKPCR